MTHLYSAEVSFVLLRSKNKVKLFTQSAENRICMGKRAFEVWGELFLKNEKAPDDRTFLPQWWCYRSPGIKRNQWESSPRGEGTIHRLFANFSIFAKMTIKPRIPSFWPGQSSLSPPILVRWWQAMARWNRDTKGRLFLAIVQGPGGLTKINYQFRANRQ